MNKLIITVLMVLAAARSFGQQRFVFERPEMGSPFTITLFATDPAFAARVADAGFRLADTLNAILSDYIDSSEINRLSATSGQGRYVRVSPPLYDILSRALEAARSSSGSYDVTIGPVVRLWRRARKLKQLPAADSIRLALTRCGYRFLHCDSGSVWLEKPGMQLDIGGLGKGFVAAYVLRLLRDSGVTAAMVNAGGKIVTGDPPPGKEGWLIGINQPQEKERLLPDMLVLDHMSVATSGDIYQYVEIGGKRYSHIVDPKTGIGLTRRRNVTAIAADGTTADWLATACSILSFKRALRLVKHIPHAALLVTEIRGKKIHASYSSNFNDYLKKQ